MSWVSTAYYVRMPSGPIAQGDVWAGLPSVSSDRLNSGIVITPRCDLAHEKSTVINYLRIVSLHDHCVEDGGIRLIEQEYQRTLDRARSILIEAKMGHLVDIGMPLQEIRDMLLQADSSGLPDGVKRSKYDSTKLSSLLSDAQRLQEMLRTQSFSPDMLRTLIPQKAIRKYKADVIRNSIADLHFLPPYMGFLESPCVVQLRFIMTCSIDVLRSAVRASSGQTVTRSGERAESHIPDRLVRLRSPYFEALMARFAALFGRVGVRDFDQEQIDRYAEWRD